MDVVITDHAMPDHDRPAARAMHSRAVSGTSHHPRDRIAELPADPALLGLLKLAKPCSQNDIAVSIHNALALRPCRENFAEPRAAR